MNARRLPSSLALVLVLARFTSSAKIALWPGFLEERVKPLWCVYDNRANERPWRYLPRDVPVAHCTALVYTYVGLSRDGRNVTSLKPDFDYGSAGLRAVSQLKASPSLTVRRGRRALRSYLALGGPPTDSRRFAAAVEGSDGARAALMESARNWLHDFGYDGLLLHIDQPEAFASSDAAINDFVFAMHEYLGKQGLFFSVVLPPEADRRSTYYSPYAYAQKLGALVLWSHDLVDQPREPTCPAPLYRSLRESHSLASVVESVRASYTAEDAARLVLSRVLLTFSLAGFHFSLEPANQRHKGHPHPPLPREILIDTASYVAYHQFCHDKGWNTTYNEVTGCVEMTGAHGWISYPGRPRRELLSDVAGAVLFDMDMDDFAGVCGKKHALTRTFSNTLNLS